MENQNNELEKRCSRNCPVCGAVDKVIDDCCVDCGAVACTECGKAMNSLFDPCMCEGGLPETEGKRTVILFSMDGKSTISMVCSNGDKVIRLHVMGDALFYQDMAYHRYQTRSDVNLILVDHGAIARMGITFDTGLLIQINDLFTKLQPGVPICHLNIPGLPVWQQNLTM